MVPLTIPEKRNKVSLVIDDASRNHVQEDWAPQYKVLDPVKTERNDIRHANRHYDEFDSFDSSPQAFQIPQRGRYHKQSEKEL